jgi:cytoskeleton protein RodZ
MAPMRAWGSVGDGGGFRWSSALQALGLVVAVTLVCSGVYAWWQRERRSAAASAAQTAAVPRREPPAATAPPVPAAVVTPAPADPGAVQTPAASSGASAEGQSAPAAQPPAVEPPGPKGAVSVQVTAVETSWVLARSDGKYAFSVTLDANQTRTVEANESVELRLGNAGGVSVALNGKPVGPLGPKGQIRTVQLNSGGFKIVSPKPPAAADPL